MFQDEKIEFHTAVFRLRDHLFEPSPIELTFEISPKQLKLNSQPTLIFYDLPVFEYHTQSQREKIEFLVNCSYDFFNSNSDQHPESSLAINGNLLKLREQKYNTKIANAIEKAKRSFRQMDFYGKLTADPKTQIQNVVIEQNKWLKVMQEE